MSTSSATSKKPLYRLPEVLVANYVVICEGEKDADTVRNLTLSNREKSWFRDRLGKEQ